MGVGLRQKGFARVGGVLSTIPLKGDGTEKRGMRHKDLKKGGASWTKGWVPLKGGSGTPLRTMFKAFS